MSRIAKINICLGLAIIILMVLNIFIGTVKIPASDVIDILLGKGSSHTTWQYIIIETRIPQMITATLSGGALAVSGLLLQTAFHNPLAGPSVFGINSGASLGVAFVMLLFSGSITASNVTFTGFFAVLTAAFVGALLVMAILLVFAQVVKSNVMLLIIGIMIGYVSSSLISLLNFFATDEGVHSYTIWGLGNFGGVPLSQIPVFAVITFIGLALALLLIKPLNTILLGEQYAQNLGINTIRLRNYLLVITGLLTAVTTAFCGPITFIGLAVPHIARLLLNTDNHKYIIPGTILSGMVMALTCNIICVLPGEEGIIPLNAITPILGAPVIIYIIIANKHK